MKALVVLVGLVAPMQTFHASFTARNADKGYRDHFVIAFRGYNEVECASGIGPLMAVADWMAHHPDYVEPRDIHCAKPGEADL